MISLHQKLDLVLASSIEQKAAIDELKRENNSLKQQLQDVSTKLQAFKEAEKNLGTNKRSSSKLPFAVLVSYIDFMQYLVIPTALSWCLFTYRHQ